VSQANISAKAIWVRSGEVLVAANTDARKPFDMTGGDALKAAAEVLADKLLDGIDGKLPKTR
jgi:hypothetical protein